MVLPVVGKSGRRMATEIGDRSRHRQRPSAGAAVRRCSIAAGAIPPRSRHRASGDIVLAAQCLRGPPKPFVQIVRSRRFLRGPPKPFVQIVRSRTRGRRAFYLWSLCVFMGGGEDSCPSIAAAWSGSFFFERGVLLPWRDGGPGVGEAHRRRECGGRGAFLSGGGVFG